MRSRSPSRLLSASVLLLCILGLSLQLLSVSGQQVILPSSSLGHAHAALWPEPHSVTFDASLPLGGPTLYVDPDNFAVTWGANNANARNPLLTQAALLQEKLFPVAAEPQNDKSLERLVGLDIAVDCPECPFQIDDDQASSTETYNISISTGDDGSKRALLYAPTAWGAIWGLQTFSQLLSFDNFNYVVYNSSIRIYDVPRFQYRGVQVDTSHHFIPLPKLKAILDGMSYNKMNVFHWQQRSAVATSIQSDVFPELTADLDPTDDVEGGSYSSTETIYTQSQVFSLVSYAKARGIHIIIENGGLESSAALGRSHPELVACPGLASRGYPALESVAMNPLGNTSLDFLRLYWGELDQTSTNYVHMGGDTIDPSCWAENENISDYMIEHGIEAAELQSAFIARVWEELIPSTNPPMFSNGQGVMYRAREDFLSVFPFGTPAFASQVDLLLFQAMDRLTLKNVTSNGFNALYSGSEWDVSNVRMRAPQAMNPHLDNMWELMYLTDPAAGVEAGYEGYVVGGQAQVYTDAVDSSAIENALWPLASAISESLWSRRAHTRRTTAETLFRLQNHVCRMLRMGMGATSLRPGYCAVPHREKKVNSSGMHISTTVFGVLVALSVIGGLYSLSVIITTISHLRAGTKAAVTASLNAPLMERE